MREFTGLGGKAITGPAVSGPMAIPSVLVGLFFATAGAAVGAWATWLADKARDRRLAGESRSQTLEEKVHHLEVRIVRLETELGFYAVLGRSQIQEAGRAQQG